MLQPIHYTAVKKYSQKTGEKLLKFAYVNIYLEHFLNSVLRCVVTRKIARKVI